MYMTAAPREVQYCLNFSRWDGRQHRGCGENITVFSCLGRSFCPLPRDGRGGVGEGRCGCNIVAAESFWLPGSVLS